MRASRLAVPLVALLMGCWEPIERGAPNEISEAARGAEYKTLEAALAKAKANPPTAGAAPSGGDTRMRTIAIDAEAAARGQIAYAACAGCHGTKGEGRVGMAPRLASASFLAAASDRMLVATIAHGRPGTTMTPWGPVLGDEKIADIVAWLRTEVPTEPVELDESPLAGHVPTGAKTFREICATCHGRSGAGYQESGSGTGIGRKAFLETATDGYLRYVIARGKSQTAMRPFASDAPTAVANLDRQEIEDVIAYLRHEAW